ncbi:MAG TPA: tRNA dihydrouridine synthase DusB [Desulfomonilia bacterium]|nr:tRNA dihydrouridine synthase DusB [Desulfomonilia bacterium]
MRAYNLEFEKGLFLAPLSGYTSWPMRMLCRQYGAELCYTEMISAAGLIRNTRHLSEILDRPQGDSPLIAQIFTNSPDEAAKASRMLEDLGFDGIDINMGCPVKKVVSKGSGAALMTKPDLAVRLAEAVVRSVNIPVSVKMRAGWDLSSLNAPVLAEALEYAGISAVILHARTRSDMYRGRPRWEILEEVTKHLRVPLVASGDIRRAEDLDMISHLGADACMIGRGAIGRPWIFRELEGGPAPDITERKETILSHLDMLCTCHGERTGVRHMRKFLSSYVKGLHGASHFRLIACVIDSHDQLFKTIDDYFSHIESF